MKPELCCSFLLSQLQIQLQNTDKDFFFASFEIILGLEDLVYFKSGHEKARV